MRTIDELLADVPALAGLPAEHLQLIEDPELLGPETERANGAPDAGGGVAAETGQERRHRDLLGGGHAPRLEDLRFCTIVVNYHSGR